MFSFCNAITVLQVILFELKNALGLNLIDMFFLSYFYVQVTVSEAEHGLETFAVTPGRLCGVEKYRAHSSLNEFKMYEHFLSITKSNTMVHYSNHTATFKNWNIS